MIDFLKARYNSPAVAILSAIAIIIFLFSAMTAQWVGGGRLIESLTGLEYTTALFIFAISVLVYVIIGGFRAVALTDAVQGVIMVVGTLILLVGVIIAGGGVPAIMQDLLNENPRLVTPFGADGSLTAAYVSSFWILVGVGVVGLPQMAVRAMSYKSSTRDAPGTRHRHNRHRFYHAQHALDRHFRETRPAGYRCRGQSHSINRTRSIARMARRHRPCGTNGSHHVDSRLTTIISQLSNRQRRLPELHQTGSNRKTGQTNKLRRHRHLRNHRLPTRHRAARPAHLPEPIRLRRTRSRLHLASRLRTLLEIRQQTRRHYSA